MTAPTLAPSALARVRVQIQQFIDSTSVFYIGQAEDLLALGFVTADMLAPGKPGRTRVTADGYRFWRTHCKRTGQYKVALMWLPHEVAEAMPGVPRTWRSTVAPLLALTEQQRQAFQAEGGTYRECDAA